MTKISIYQIDEYVTADDKWIGTDVNTYNKTKNFTPRKLSNYFNGGQVINTGVDLLYKYFTITPPETRPTGTLSFETEIGQTVNFSAISTFLLSKTTLKGNDVVEFLNFLVGTNVLLYKAKNINLFGSYKIVSVEEYLPEPNFFVVNVEFIDGNGFIEEDEDYMISIIDISSGGGGSQNLQEVTDEGATTTNPITITVGDGEGDGVSSFSSQGYGIKGESNETFGVYGSSPSSAGVYGIGATGVYGESTNGNGVEGSSVDGNAIYGNSGNVVGVYARSDYGTGLYGYTEDGVAISVQSNGIGLEVNGNGTIAIEANLGNSNKGLVINSGTSSTGNFIELAKNSVNKLTVNQEGELSIVKIPGGLSTEYLMADGTTTTGGTGGGGIPHATASGTDTYTATVSGVTSYSDGDAYLIRFPIGNTTVATLNINALGAIPLYRNNDGPLIGGDVQANGEMLCVYNSTANTFQCIGTSPNSIISYVTNADSVTITKGQVVYAFGGTGDRMTVKLASNIGDSTSAQTVGIVLSASIAANQKGFIIFQGLLDNLSILPTATWADGDPVYLGATAGSITKVKPYAPNHLVYIGIVTTASNGGAGRMYVRVQNGYELDELHNVQAQTPTLKDTLWYDNTVSPAQWKTASISTILGYTPANDVNVVHLTGNETISGLKTFTDNLTAGRYLYSGGSIFPEFGHTFYINGIGATHYFGGGTSNTQNNLEVSNGTFNIGLQTASTIASFDTNKNVVSLTTANGYPTLTELKSLVGVSTTAIQTQLNAKANDANVVHLTGNETIAGEKTFSSNIRLPVSLANTSATVVYGNPSSGELFIGFDTVGPTALEMQYVKGVTSGIQTQLGSKQSKSLSAYTIMANNTNATADATAQVFRNEPSKAYTGTITPTASTSAPTGATNHTYSWCQVGDLVTIRLSLDYATAGVGVTSLACILPSDCPTPELPSGVSTALNVISYGVGTMAANKASVATMGTAALRLKTTGPNTFDIQISRLSGGYSQAYATIQYFTT